MRTRHTFLAALALLVLVSAGSPGQSQAQHFQTVIVDLADADLVFVGEVDDWDAYSASPAGDVNGDGYGDLVIGSPKAGEGIPAPGKAYLVLGRPRDEWPGQQNLLAEADASFVGCPFGGMTGRQNHAAGDVNGDGYDDLLISGWKCRGAEPYQGKAFLFLGRQEADWGQDSAGRRRRRILPGGARE